MVGGVVGVDHVHMLRVIGIVDMQRRWLAVGPGRRWPVGNEGREKRAEKQREEKFYFIFKKKTQREKERDTCTKQKLREKRE